MKAIKVNGAKGALVDDQDHELLKKFNWRVDGKGYAVRSEGIGNSRSKNIYMHREIMGFPEGMEIDHISRDKLDNRRSNLRVCTRGQNSLNRASRASSKDSQYKGVCFHKQNNRWMARCYKDGKAKTKMCETELEAAIAYDAMAKEIHGEFAYLNF